jgi:hypothetical protein
MNPSENGTVLIHPTSDLFNSAQELGGLQPLSF